MAASEQSIAEARVAFHAASEKLGENMVALDVSEPFALADIFLIVSAKNERQVQAIAEFVEEKLSESGVKARMREGMEAARWVLLDFGNLVVHVMHEQEREFYSLERLWRDCPVVKLG
ncbi:MAG: ribosome silencing factor [Actinomycetota bacterium]